MPQPVHINGQPTHHPTEEPLVTITTTIELTVDDVAAVLHNRINSGGTYAELDNDEQVRLLVTDTIINTGYLKISEMRATVPHGGLLNRCRHRALDVFGPPRHAAPTMVLRHSC